MKFSGVSLRAENKEQLIQEMKKTENHYRSMPEYRNAKSIKVELTYDELDNIDFTEKQDFLVDVVIDE